MEAIAQPFRRLRWNWRIFPCLFMWGEGERLREQQVSSRFDNCEEAPLKAVPMICLALIFATPAVAAPQWVETACWRYANRILPAPTPREREAYFDNCIADWTAGAPPPQGRRNYDRNRY